MRSLSSAFIALIIVLISFSTASAELIGVEALIADQYPDIIFDNIGVIDYTAATDQFLLGADDLRIAYSPTESYYLSGTGGTTTMSIDLNVDENGDIVGTGSMVEIVTQGEVTIRNNTYGSGITLLAGSVYAFGWGETAGTTLGDFDFLIDGVTGALILDGLWPDNIDVGVIADAENLNGWGGSWGMDFHLDKVKGDKAPIPEPATLLMLGLGAVALLGKRRR